MFSILHSLGQMSKLNKRYWLKTEDIFKTTRRNNEKLLEAYCLCISKNQQRIGTTTPTLSRLKKKILCVKHQHNGIQINILICLSLIIVWFSMLCLNCRWILIFQFCVSAICHYSPNEI